MTGNRLEIRPISRTDAGELAELLTNEQIRQTYMVPDFPDEATLNRMVERFLELSQSANRYVRGAYLDGRMIGFINDVDMQAGSVELGYVIHPNHWGRGYATEMLRVAMGELREAGFSTLRAGAFAENAASIRVMEKCAMVKIPLAEDIDYRGIRHHCVYYEYNFGGKP